MKSFEEIVKPFQEQLNKVNYKKIDAQTDPTVYLFQKWAYRVGKNWYGFDLAGVPFIWAQIIDRFLEEVQKECPDFEIHQVKLKFGGNRTYLGNINDKLLQNSHDFLINFLANDD